MAETGTPFSAEVAVRALRFASAETGFAVLEADSGRERVTLVGMLAHLERGERVQVLGEWVNDRRYGPQVKVSEARPLGPATEQAMLAYLRRVRHVGEARARRLAERHGAGVLDAIDRDPRAELGAAGLSGRRLAEAVTSWDALRALRGLHLLLAPHGLAYLVARLHNQYGDRALRQVRAEPYELTSVFGVGFALADRIGHAGGIAPTDPGRLRAGVLHVLADAERDGSTCLPAAVLLTRAEALLGLELAPSLPDEMSEDGALERREDGGTWFARAATAALEAELAERVRALLDAGPAKRFAAPRRPSADAGDLSDAQWAGVANAFAHRLSIITGGPGTGKTATVKAVGTAAARGRAGILLAAPTGRAAVRMAQATGLEASTVHSALGWIPGQGPQRDEEHPLETDLLVVDESSMANLELLATLLRAVGPETHVVLVGDADQLSPVGAGKPFAELVAGGLVPTARLETIFRQAAGSMIVQGAHAVRVGRPPVFEVAQGMRRDLFLLERPDPEAAAQEIIELVARRLPAHYGVDPLEDVQVFAPVYRGPLGIDALNRRLRDALNPDGAPAGGGRLRMGDKLMLSGRNLHALGVMNGTLMRLISEVDDGSDDDGSLVLSAEGRMLTLSAEEAERLVLAYACSVHKGQGIELPIAVLVAHPAAGAFFLRREMLYTAMTRSTLATIIVGTREVVERAARAPDAKLRYSGLVARLAGQPGT